MRLVAEASRFTKPPRHSRRAELHARKRVDHAIALFVAPLHAFAHILRTLRNAAARWLQSPMVQVKASANRSRKIRGIAPPNYGNRTS